MSEAPNPDVAALPQGTRVDNYEVVRCLGRGGVGAAVYLVAWEGRPFALKLLAERLGELGPEARASTEARARREVAALASLSHPNIVGFHGFGTWPGPDGYLYLVQEYVDGDRLLAWQAKTHPSFRRVAEVFVGLLDGLSEMHARDIFHRDLKSANVLVSKDGVTKLVDLGISKQSRSADVTEPGVMSGTPSHRSPEYIRFHTDGPGRLGARYEYRPTDELHAVGYMLYEALTGRRPFGSGQDGGERAHVTRSILEDVPRSPKGLNPAVPEPLAALALALLAKQPERRPQTAHEVALTLRDALASADATWDVSACATVHGDGCGASDKVASKKELLALEPPEAPVRQSTFRPPGGEPPRFVSPDAPGPATLGRPSPGADSLSLALEQARALGAQLTGRPSLAPRTVVLLAGAALVLVMAAAVVASSVGRTGGKEEVPSAREVRAEAPSGPLPLGLVPVGAPFVNLPSSPPQVDGAGASGSGETVLVPPHARHVKGGSDAAQVTAMLDETYGGRPTLPSGASAAAPVPAPELEPSWIRHGVVVGAAGGSGDAGPKGLGVPFGEHLRLRLKSNLDSRTLSNGMVEAILLRPVLVHGDTVIPSRTMVYGQGQASNGRFVISFSKMKLPDDSEVAFKGYALDPSDGKPGLAASRALTGTGGSGGQEGAGTVVAKSTASTLLGTVATGAPGAIANSAGQAALNQAGGGSQSAAAESAILLDAGQDFEVFVSEAF